MHLVGFITKKFVTMHGHMNVKLPTLDRRPAQAINVEITESHEPFTV